MRPLSVLLFKHVSSRHSVTPLYIHVVYAPKFGAFCQLMNEIKFKPQGNKIIQISLFLWKIWKSFQKNSTFFNPTFLFQNLSLWLEAILKELEKTSLNYLDVFPIAREMVKIRAWENEKIANFQIDRKKKEFHMTDYTSYSSNISLSGLSKTSKIFQID